MRTLASIQKIDNVIPHPNADALDICTVLGWKVITKRDEFKVGDYCVYCEIDSLMPQTPEFEFLKKNNYRIRTIRLRGEISQGICFPLSVLPSDYFSSVSMSGVPYYSGPIIGDDVTEVLGITKYEPPVPANLGGRVRGNFPSFLFKTDETRIQSIPEIIEKTAGMEMYVTEKLDGSSATFYIKDGRFGVCSRNLDLDETEDNSFWRVARQQGIEEKLRSLNKNVAVQGELMGEGIQKNKLQLKGLHFFVFQVFDIDAGTYYDMYELDYLCSDLGFETVPMIDPFFTPLSTVDEYVAYAQKRSVLNSKVWAEGFVFRPKFIKNTPYVNNLISFKSINPNFLLKYEDA